MMSGAGSEAGGAWFSDARFATLTEIEQAARASLPDDVWNFLVGGAGDENTHRDNRLAYRRWQFLPRLAALDNDVDLRTSVLGHDVALPVFTAPFGFDRLFHPEGLVAVARAQAPLGIPLVVSRSSAPSLEEVASAAGSCPLYLQVLGVGDPAAFEDLGARARRAGYAGLIVTVDGAAVGWRDRSRNDRFLPDLSSAWGNYRTEQGELDQGRLARSEGRRRPVWGWEEIGARCDAVGLPWIPKGVLTADEAGRALEAGSSGVYVSNHGGRALDDVPATLDALVDVVADPDLGPNVPLLVDGGVRRAGDVVKALALGADAVGLGRLVAMALAAGGYAAVRDALELLEDELRTVMTLLGRHRIEEVSGDCIRRVPL